MTPTELQRWSQRYRADLDHRIALDRIRREGAEKIEKIRADWAALRRKEEALNLKILRSDVRHARWQAKHGIKAFPLDLAQRWHVVQLELSGTTPPDEVPLVPAWQRDIQQCAQLLGVTIDLVDTSAMNAYSFGRSKRVEIGPVISATSYAVARHKLGHQARPCLPAHRPVMTNAKLKKTACVACELSAWRWAIEGARPTWTRRMHDCLAHSLQTYRQYARQAEQREITELCSDLGFRYAQLTRARRTA